MPQDLTNYGSGDGLVPSDNKPLPYFPEQMLTQTYVAKYIWIYLYIYIYISKEFKK